MSSGPLQLSSGEVVSHWTVEKKLGSGAYGLVYLVHRSDDPTKLYAMKTEPQAARNHVKMEVRVLLKLNATGSRHCCDLVKSGTYDIAGGIRFMVMTLVGRSLADLMKKKTLSRPCALSIGLQLLEALEDLHEAGFIHRDIKPHNAGLGTDARKVFLLDFGMCREYKDADGAVKPPRLRVRFRGTRYYASLRAHLDEEQYMKDDLESWLYTVTELITGHLPWSNLKKDQFFEEKVRCRTSPGVGQLFSIPCPMVLIDILKLIDDLQPMKMPPYQQIYQMMKTFLVNCGRPEFPYDCEK